MEEFIKKLIGRLEEERDSTYFVETANPQNQNWHGVRERDLINEIIQIINEMAEEHNGGWIPCEKEYPPDNVLVRVTYLGIPDGCPLCNLLAYRCRGKWNSERGESVPFKVIAWKYDEPYNPKGE